MHRACIICSQPSVPGGSRCSAHARPSNWGRGKRPAHAGFEIAACLAPRLPAFTSVDTTKGGNQKNGIACVDQATWVVGGSALMVEGEADNEKSDRDRQPH
jgi:hypothetical protein